MTRLWTLLAVLLIALGGCSGAPVISTFDPWVADPAAEADIGAVVLRTVAVGDLLVVVTQSDATAFDRKSGAQRWFLPAPRYEGRRTAFCGVSTDADSAGRLAISTGFVTSERPLNANCIGVTVLDTVSGRLGWNTVVAYPGGVFQGDVEGMPLEIVGNTVVVGWDFNVYGIDLADGSQLWHQRLASEAGLPYPNCPITGLAPGGAGAVSVLTHCIRQDGSASYSLAQFAEDGRVLRSRDLTDADIGLKPSSIRLISGAPVVLSATPRDTHDRRVSLVGFTEDWRPGMRRISHFPGPDAIAAIPVGFAVAPPGPYHFQNRAIAGGHTLYGMTAPNQGVPNRLAALDLESGREQWTFSEPGRLTMQVLAVTEREVVVLQSALDDGNDLDQSIVHLDRSTGVAISRVTEAPRNMNGGAAHAPFYGYTWADGRVYAVHVANTGRTPYRLVFTLG